MSTGQDVIGQEDMIPGSKQPIAMLGGWNDPPATLFHQNSANSLRKLEENGDQELLKDEENSENKKVKNIGEIMRELNEKVSGVSNGTAQQFIKTKLSKIEEDWRNQKFNDDIKLHLSLYVDSLNESNWSEAFQQIQELSKYQDIVKNWLLALRKLKTELSR